MATLASNNRVNEKRETITIDYDRFMCLRGIAYQATLFNSASFVGQSFNPKDLSERINELQKLEISAMVGVWNQS